MSEKLHTVAHRAILEQATAVLWSVSLWKSTKVFACYAITVFVPYSIFSKYAWIRLSTRSKSIHHKSLISIEDILIINMVFEAFYNHAKAMFWSWVYCQMCSIHCATVVLHSEVELFRRIYLLWRMLWRCIQVNL